MTRPLRSRIDDSAAGGHRAGDRTVRLMTTDIHLRGAHRLDLPSLAELAAATFRQAFAADNDPVDFEAYVREAFSQSRLLDELEDAKNTFLVAVDDGEQRLVGYSKLRRGTVADGARGQQPIELERIYVDESRLGAGLGTRLMRRCIEVAMEEGRDSMWLGVWERNERAIRFYERWGFEVVGNHTFQLGSDTQTDLVMERLLEA